jgi:hypothetical protein
VRVKIRFTPRSHAAFGNEFVDHRRSWRNVPAHNLLSSGQMFPQGSLSMFILLVDASSVFFHINDIDPIGT